MMLPYPFSSTEVFMTSIELITIEVVTVAFCCFVLLMLVVGAACVYKMFDHKQGVHVRVCVNNKFTDWKCVSEPILNSFYLSLLFQLWPTLIWQSKLYLGWLIFWKFLVSVRQIHQVSDVCTFPTQFWCPPATYTVVPVRRQPGRHFLYVMWRPESESGKQANTETQWF